MSYLFVLFQSISIFHIAFWPLRVYCRSNICEQVNNKLLPTQYLQISTITREFMRALLKLLMLFKVVRSAHKIGQYGTVKISICHSILSY